MPLTSRNPPQRRPRRRPLRSKVATPPPPPPLLPPRRRQLHQSARPQLQIKCSLASRSHLRRWKRPRRPPPRVPPGRHLRAGAGARRETAARWEPRRRRAAPSRLGSRSRPQTVLETVYHLCHRKPSGEEGGAEPTNKRLRPPAGIGAGTATGSQPFPGRGRGGRPRAAGFVRGSRGAGAVGRASPPPSPLTRAPAALLGPLGDALAAAEEAALRPPPAPISTWSRLSSNARGGLQKLAPGPPSTCPRAAEARSRVFPVPFPTRRPRPPGHLLPVGGERGYLNARGS